MNIAIAFDRNYMRYGIVTLTSLFENNPGKHDVYVMHRVLEDKDIEFIQNSLSRYDVRVRSLKMDFSEIEEYLPVTEYWTYETYCSLKLVDMLPEDVSRILVLDPDIIVDKPIPELYDIDFEGNDLAAADESNGYWTYDNFPDFQRVFFESKKDIFRYFNTGTMMLNVEKLRKDYSYEIYFNKMKEWDFKMPACEQDVLNFIHMGKVKFIPWERYNFFGREGSSFDDVRNGDRTAIVHFVGAKPWNCVGLHYDMERLWWLYAAYTPFYSELMEEFIQDALTNKTVENSMRSLHKENEELREAMKKVNEFLKKMS